MLAVVVRQPWASMIQSGSKRLEIRARRTSHRGPLLIVAGQHGDAEDGLPRGVALATVRVADCRRFEPADAEAACVPWRPGLWAWVLDDVQPAPQIAVRGMPGLFSHRVAAEAKP